VVLGDIALQQTNGQGTFGMVEEGEGDGSDQVLLCRKAGREILPAGRVDGVAE
jgi:hypothetical protein